MLIHYARLLFQTQEITRSYNQGNSNTTAAAVRWVPPRYYPVVYLLPELRAGGGDELISLAGKYCMYVSFRPDSSVCLPADPYVRIALVLVWHNTVCFYLAEPRL